MNIERPFYIVLVCLIAVVFYAGYLVGKNKNEANNTKPQTDETIKTRIDTSDNDELRSIIDSTITD